MAFKKLPYATLEATAANSLVRVIRDSGAPVTITSHRRKVAEQERLFLSRYVPYVVEYAPGRKDRRVYKGRAYYRKPGVLPVSVPGTSKHELGLAIDVARGSTLWNWLVKNGKRYGWIQVLPVDDPVHFEYYVARDEVRAAIIKRRNQARARLAAVHKALGALRWKATKKRRQAAQRLLKAYGLYPGAIDGIPGDKTDAGYAALKAAAK